MKKRLFSIMTLAAAFGFASCSHDRSPDSGNYDPNDPGYEYALEGDMYHAVSYEGWSQMEGNTNPYNANGSNQRPPVPGTVARGQADYVYPLPAGNEGYAASAALVNPLPATPANLAEGKRLYETYCWHCHGLEGKSDGPVMASGKFPKPGFGEYQTDYIRKLPMGQMYHTITWGKNLMGPHGLFLNPDQRWKIVHYIKQLSAMPGAAPEGGAPADRTNAAGGAGQTAAATETK